MYHVSKFLTVLAQAGSIAAYAIQANYYSDSECNNWLVTKEYTGGPGSILPGVAGAFGAIWVDESGMPTICPGGWEFYICGDKYCNEKWEVSYGQCFGTTTGVWVQAECMPVQPATSNLNYDGCNGSGDPCVTFEFLYEGTTFDTNYFSPWCDTACNSIGFGVTWAKLERSILQTVSCSMYTSEDCSGTPQYIGDGSTSMDQNNPKRSFHCYAGC